MRQRQRKSRSSCIPSGARARRQSYPKAGRTTACGLRETGHWRSQAFLSFTLWRYAMMKTLIAVAVAGAFALPMAALASAGSDNIVVAQAGGGAGGGDASTSTRQPGANPPGAASPGSARDASTSTDRDTGAASRTNPSGSGASGTSATTNRMGFDRLDKNRDGFISRDEAKDAPELNTRFSEL